MHVLKWWTSLCCLLICYRQRIALLCQMVRGRSDKLCSRMVSMPHRRALIHHAGPRLRPALKPCGEIYGPSVDFLLCQHEIFQMFIHQAYMKGFPFVTSSWKAAMVDMWRLRTFLSPIFFKERSPRFNASARVRALIREWLPELLVRRSGSASCHLWKKHF